MMLLFEYGEVFVIDDGVEIDFDLGYYEWFIGVFVCIIDLILFGCIYFNVLEKECCGDYLGKMIQVVFYVINEIKDFICIGDDEVDFMLCEIGGIVGDIEGLLFFEVICQFIYEKLCGECILMYLMLLLYLVVLGELKIKLIQYLVKEFQLIGLVLDVLVCCLE